MDSGVVEASRDTSAPPEDDWTGHDITCKKNEGGGGEEDKKNKEKDDVCRRPVSLIF